MIKKPYFTPNVRICGMAYSQNFLLSLGTEDISGSDPVDWDWDNA